MPPTVPTLTIRVRIEDDDTAVVQLSGELDIATGPLLSARLGALLDGLPDRPLSRLVVDLTDLDFVDVVGLGVLLRIERQLAAVGGTVVLRRPTPLVQRVIALLNLHDRLQLEA